MKKIILFISVILFAVACNDGEEIHQDNLTQLMEYDDLGSSRKSFAAGRKMESATNNRIDNVTVELSLIHI